MPSAFNFKRVKKYQLRTIAWSAWMILPLPRVAEKLRWCVVGHSTSWQFCFPVERLKIVWPRPKDLAQKVHISTGLWNQNKSDVSIISCDGEVILHQAYLCHAYRRLPRMHRDHRVATKPCGSQPKRQSQSNACISGSYGKRESSFGSYEGIEGIHNVNWHDLFLTEWIDSQP